MQYFSLSTQLANEILANGGGNLPISWIFHSRLCFFTKICSTYIRYYKAMFGVEITGGVQWPTLYRMSFEWSFWFPDLYV